MTTAILLLAAGESKRMGQPKQLLPYRGKPLIQHAIDVALATNLPLTVVLGAHAGVIRPHLSLSDEQVTLNPQWQEGMGTSIHAGLSALLTTYPQLNAVLITLADQPLVTPTLLQQLLTAHRAGATIAAATYQNAPGVPALFTRPFFPQLLALPPNAGAKSILNDQPHHVHLIPTTLATLDLDTPEDYQALLQRTP